MTTGTRDEGSGDVVDDVGVSPPQSLQERVAVLEVLVRDLGEGVSRDFEDLKAAIVELAGAPSSVDAGDVIDGGNDADEDAAPPRSWGVRASADDWRGLAAWVDWLAETYDHQPSRAVLPCWPAHGGAVHELAALRAAWTTAATTDVSDEPGDAMAAWHEGLLRPCLTRLREDYQLKACTDRHTPPRPRRPTDRDLLETALRSDAFTPVGAENVNDISPM